ncbi:MAG: hypothetical protein HYX78_01935 [Armatimonadetes bacterium]|nr:hypothetical protein [Armatimonadota bacterium]
MLYRCLSVCFILLFTAVPPAPAGQWYSGIIHVHTTFSDGSDNVPQRVELAKKLGYKFVIITDHYEQIGSPEKVSLRYVAANPRGVDVGFPDYVRNCGEQTRDGSFVAIPGAEIQTIWHAEPDTTDASHTVALGSVGTSGDDKLIKMFSEADRQEDVIKWVDKHHLLSVAAHPTLISTKSATITPWEWQRNRYDLRKPDRYVGIRGVEFFNSQTDQQNHDVLAWYLSLLREEMKKPKDKRKPIFVTAGCDSHGWKDPNDLERWLRGTYVWANGLSTSGILDALASGRSYASTGGVYLKEMNYLPGEPVQNVDTPTFRFTVAFPSRSTSFLLTLSKSYGIPLKLVADLIGESNVTTTIMTYRDGELVPESRATFKGMPTSVKYTWTDKTAAPGEHWYVLWVDGRLVTSPIRLETTGRAEDMQSFRQGTMLFVRGGNIWRADLTAGKATLVARNGRHPAWNPDNRIVLFTRLLSGAWDKSLSVRIDSWGLFSHDLAEGKTARIGKLSSEQPITAARSARDGELIYQYANFKGQPELYRFPGIAGRDVRFQSALSTAQYHWGASISGDGKWLAYQGGGVDSRYNTIAISDLAELQVRIAKPLNPTVIYGAGGTAWSPDNRWIAIADSDGNLLKMSLEGSVTTLVHGNRSFRVLRPTISPDGRAVAFEAQGQIWVCAVSGGDAQVLVAHATEPCWQHQAVAVRRKPQRQHAPITKTLPRTAQFPDSTYLGTVRVRETWTAVRHRLGDHYRVLRGTGDDITVKVAYSDPRQDAALIIGMDGTKLSDSSVVSLIKLERTQGRRFPKARVAFAAAGNARGVRLGDSLSDIHAAHPGEPRSEWHGDYQYAVQSPHDWPCYVHYRVSGGKVTAMSSGYTP